MIESTDRETPRLDVYSALYQRQSTRAFLPDAVPRLRIERMLMAAARAPSGVNMQPWRVRVLTGAARQRLVDAVLSFRNAHPGVENWAYPYYPSIWREPYLARRRKVGWDLYGLLGIGRAEGERMRAQHNRNFTFFDAPVGLMLTIDADLEVGSLLDYGHFILSLALAAEAEGLATCLQACWVGHADIVADALSLPASEKIVCGIALGYADRSATVNQLRTERAPLADFVSFIDA